MKKTTMAILTIASVAGVATLANAVPFGPNDLPQSGGLNISKPHKAVVAALLAELQLAGMGNVLTLRRLPI
jgi:hypothetical protein